MEEFMIKVQIVTPCINQDDKKRLRTGQIVNLSEMEASRHLAEGNAKIPLRKVNRPIETQMTTPLENRGIVNAQTKRDKNRE